MYGTEHVLVKLMDSWKFALDENTYAGTGLMDISKAFNCVPYGHLIAKMHAYGLSTNAYEFMSSYLSDRYQRFKISNVKRSWMSLQKEIPQGSSLGPFLFNIFMNDILYFIELCDLVNYADDNTRSIIECTIKVVLAILKQDTKNAIKWFIITFMHVNPSKFQCMYLKPLTNKEEMLKFIEINGTNIPCEKEVKLLGITIDENLKFDKHVNIICKKAA